MFDRVFGYIGSSSPQNIQRWLLAAVTYFMGLGFFDTEVDGSISGERQNEQSIARCIEGAYWDEERTDFDPSDELADLRLLRYDVHRVWWEDLEADVCEENEVYVRTLREWAGISRGAFTPENVTEKWEGPYGPVHLTFMHDGVLHALRPRNMDDFIDITIIREINNIISASGYRFEVYEEFDQTAFVVMLTAQERVRLERERGWRFRKDV